MALGVMKARTEGRVKTTVNLQNLLLPTEFHPKGRVVLDPKTNMPKVPKREILYMDTVKATGRKREVNGGHAKKEGSVWRTALRGPSRYLWKAMRDEMNYRVKNTRCITAPELVEEEAYEARQFITYALVTKALPYDFLGKKHDHDKKTREMFDKVDAAFYKWKDAQKEEVELGRISEVFKFLPV